jgi:hypothetical protein
MVENSQRIILREAINPVKVGMIPESITVYRDLARITNMFIHFPNHLR